MKLMIVESPNKIKKISKILGSDWKVAASVGHIRDLPEKELGVSPPEFKPKYVVSSEKKKVVSNLRNQIRNCSEVYLATDPDREGEAIAWHLKDALQIENPYRVTFNEITKQAIHKAIDNRRKIDMNLVAAQEARRVLDRIVGYEISPLLSNQAGIPLSAGRVQSPAVKLTVLREQQINQFCAQNFYTVEASIGGNLKAQLDAKNWCEDGKHIFEKDIADNIAANVDTLIVSDIKEEGKEVKPRVPLTTSTLQQVSSKVFKLTPADTMKVAQSLFEQGVITYHRTDSPNLSAEGFLLVKEYLTEQNYQTQEKQLTWKTKENAQEAHEAIRPTDIKLAEAGKTEKEKQVYSLIRERTLASTMLPAIDSTTKITLTANKELSIKEYNNTPSFIISGKIEKYPGWREICNVEPAKITNKTITQNFNLGEEFETSTKVINKKTEPPQRFTEATLIQALERLGIGRPSTYASILQNIENRKYIKKFKPKDDKVCPTQTGEKIVGSLDFMTFMNLDFTKILEEKLDDIAKGEGSYKKLVQWVHNNIQDESSDIKIESLVETEKCPSCSKPIKRLQSTKNKKQYFWVHIEESDAENCVRFINDNEKKPVIVDRVISECPECSKPIVRKYSKGKDFYFWVHEDESDKKDCIDFIKDESVASSEA